MPKSTAKLAPAVAPLLAGAAKTSGQTIPPASERLEDQLIAVLRSDASRKEKVDACRQLAVIGTKDAVPGLAALLSNEALSHMARYALERIPDPSVDDALREALENVKGRLLVGVVGSIGVRRDARAVQTLTGLLKGSDADVARVAARTLGRIATPEATRALRETLAKASGELRPAVADGCLSCAEALLGEGKRSEAAAIYQDVGRAELPTHFRVAAAHGAILARQPGGAR